MLLSDFHPRPALVHKVTRVDQPKFPVIDAHNHLAEPFGGGWDKRPLPALLDRLDEAGVRLYVDLDGGWGEDVLNHHLDHFKAPAPERFMVFGGVDWSAWAEQGNCFGEWAAHRLLVQSARGAQGLKIWKPFGLSVKDNNGSLAAVDDPRLDPIWAVDDPRLDPIWQTAAELNLPVMIHVADPVAFFDPLDGHNEHYQTLVNHPDWRFPAPQFPPFIKILEDLANLIARHSKTTFIAAHVGCYAENLNWVSRLLERCPNAYVDIAARINELGRQPYTSRKFFLQHSDRILFGLDLGPDVPSYRIHYRFLETDDEYFNYYAGETPDLGYWSIYGLFLPDEVLEKVYYLNAKRVLRLTD
jgi:hypothetical protein